MGGIREKNWQAHSDLTIFAGYAPQENEPSEHKEHFWDHVTKTMAKLPRRTSVIFGGDFIGDAMPDDAATPLRDAHRQRRTRAGKEIRGWDTDPRTH